MSRFLSYLILGLIIVGAIGYLLSHRAKADNETYPLSTSNYDQWQPFESPVSKFKVLMPATPHKAGSNMIDPKSGQKKRFATFIAPNIDGSIYMVTVIVPEQEGEGNAELELNQTIQDLVSLSNENELKDLQKGEFKNMPAYDFVISNGEGVVTGKAVKNGKYLYVLSAMKPDGLTNSDDYSYFINSFEPRTNE